MGKQSQPVIWQMPELKANETLVISDRYAYFDIPAWKGAGVAVPISH